MARATRQDVTRALTRGPRGVRRLAKSISGQPPITMLQAGPTNSKKSIRRLIKRDPSDGLSMPEANAITDTHIDLGRASSVRIISQGNAYERPTGAGRKTIIPARKGRLKRR